MSAVISKSVARAALLASLGSIGSTSALRLRAVASASQSQFAKGDIIDVPAMLMLERTAAALGVSVDDPLMATMKQYITNSLGRNPNRSLKVAVTGVSPGREDVNVRFFTGHDDFLLSNYDLESADKAALANIAVPASAEGVAPVMVRSEKYPTPCDWDCRQSFLSDTKLRVGMHVTVDNYYMRNIVDYDYNDNDKKVQANGRIVQVLGMFRSDFDGEVETKYDSFYMREADKTDVSDEDMTMRAYNKHDGRYNGKKVVNLEKTQQYEVDSLVAEAKHGNSEEKVRLEKIEKLTLKNQEKKLVRTLLMKKFVMPEEYAYYAEYRAGMVVEQATVHHSSRTVYNSEGIEGEDSSSYTTYKYKVLEGGEKIEDLIEYGWEKTMIPAFNGIDEKKPLVDGMQVQYLTNENPKEDLVAAWFVVQNGVMKTREHTINEDGEFDSSLYRYIEPQRLRWIEVAENTLPFTATPEDVAHRVRVTPTKYNYGSWIATGEAFEGTMVLPEYPTISRSNPSSVATEVVKPDGSRQWYRNADIAILE